VPPDGGQVRDRVIERVPFHYGWVILASGALGAFMTTPGQTIGVSSFFDPLAKDLGLSRAEVALSQAMRTAVFWSLSATNILSNALGTGLLLNHYDLLARGGIPREAAAMVFAPLAIAQVLATLATGPVLDRLPPHRLVAVPMTMMAMRAARIAAARKGKRQQQPGSRRRDDARSRYLHRPFSSTARRTSQLRTVVRPRSASCEQW
jgi:hypothetical protein